MIYLDKGYIIIVTLAILQQICEENIFSLSGVVRS